MDMCFRKSIWSVTPSLQVEIYDPYKHISYYLNFIGVDYFDGPVAWQGANFRIADADECLKYLRSTTRHEGVTDQSLLGH